MGWPAKGTKAYRIRCNAIKQALADPKIRIARSAARRKEWADSTIRKRHLETRARNKLKMSRILKQVWANTDLRKRVGRKIKKVLANPKIRKKMSESKKEFFRKCPNALDQMSKRARKQWTPKLRNVMSLHMKRRWRNTDLGETIARARVQKRGRESSLEKLLRDAFNLPHHDILKFGKAWDSAFPRYKVFVECQGCFDHDCQRCGYEDLGVMRKRDRRKKYLAKKNGWRVVYLWWHDRKKFAEDPNDWFERKVVGK